ncbi:MAG: DMT family transporter [FCB group bacterium]|nr:DMT family transporter [FCB group bacterium]
MNRTALYSLLGLATLAVSWAAIIIRLADADPISTALYRMGFAALIIAPFALGGLRTGLRRISTSDRALLITSGIALGLHFACWISSLKYTSISNSVVIVATHPFFVAVAEAVFFKEKLTRNALFGMAVAFVGMVIIAGSDLELGSEHLLGDVLAFFGAVFAGLYLILGRKIRRNLDNRHYVFPVYLIATITLLAILFIFGSPIAGFSGKVWLLFFLLALIPTVIGHTTYNYLLKFVRAHIVAITILGEPIGATIFAALIFSEYPSPATYMGGSLILIGIFLALIKSKSDTTLKESA